MRKPSSAAMERFARFILGRSSKREYYKMSTTAPTLGMRLVIQVPISGQTTIGALTDALNFRKS
jgi:hypothetical protein